MISLIVKLILRIIDYIRDPELLDQMAAVKSGLAAVKKLLKVDGKRGKRKGKGKRKGGKGKRKGDSTDNEHYR